MATFDTFLACIRLQGPNSFQLCEKNENWVTKILANYTLYGRTKACLQQCCGIRDILVRIRTTNLRIRILRFSSLTFKITKKILFFLLITFWSTFPSFFKDKKSFRSHQTAEIKIFVYFFSLIMKGWDWFHRHYSARNYRPCFRENQPKRSFSIKWKRAFWACFRENWVYKFGHR